MKKTGAWAALFYCAMTICCFAEPSAFTPLENSNEHKGNSLTGFTEGNSFYKNGQYDQALERYASLLDNGPESSALYFNMGNCYFKKKEWGRAILNYERAARLSPRDPDIAFNERLALSKVRAQTISRSSSLRQRLSKFLFRKLTLDEVTVGLVLIYLSGFVFIASAAFYQKKSSAGWRWGGASILLLFLFGFALLHDRINTLDRDGIVIVKVVSAKFEPSPDATTYFELSEGMKVMTLEEQKDWLKVRRSDGKIGWIPQNTQEII